MRIEQQIPAKIFPGFYSTFDSNFLCAEPGLQPEFLSAPMCICFDSAANLSTGDLWLRSIVISATWAGDPLDSTLGCAVCMMEENEADAGHIHRPLASNSVISKAKE